MLRNLLMAALAAAAVANGQELLSGLLAQLESRDQLERSDALSRIATLPGAAKSPVVCAALLSRLDQENQIIRQTLQESHGQHGVSEGFAEYVSDLAGIVAECADWNDARTVRVLAQGSYNPDSPFAKRLAGHMDLILPVLTEDSASDVWIVRSVTLAFIGEILRVYKPERLKPEGAAQLLDVLAIRASAQEPDRNVRSEALYVLAKIADLNQDGKIDCADVALVRSALGSKPGVAGFDARADVNLDGAVDAKDLAFVAVRLSSGTHCPADR